MDYQRIYNELIEKARSESRVKVKGGPYYEAHHIIPKCLGGGGEARQWKTHPNIVLLTAREHFLSHRLLCAIHPTEKKLWYALMAMSTGRKNNIRMKPSARLYEQIMMEVSLYRSLDRVGKPSPMKGKLNPVRAELNRTRVHPSKGKPNPAVAAANKLRKGKPNPGASKYHKGRPKSESQIQKQQKEINQYTLDGTYVRTWNSLNEAAAFVGVHAATLSRCASGNLKSAAGFIWRRVV